MAKHFISYSAIDGLEFALRLHDALVAGPPSFPVWLDKHGIRAGEDWDEQVADAISLCESFLLIMTPDSVHKNSVCKQELTHALRYKKPIVPLRFDDKAELPFRLNTRHYIDFVGMFDSGLAKLRIHIAWLSSPPGILQQYKYRRQDTERDLRRSQSVGTQPDNTQSERQRLLDDAAILDKEIAHWSQIVENPRAADNGAEARVEAGLELARQPFRPVTVPSRLRFINQPPGVAPSYFQDRYVETRVIGDFLKDPAARLMTVVGRAGVGKTALVCRLLKSLEGGQLPDDGGQLAIDGIVYLRANSLRGANVPRLFGDLIRLLPDDTAGHLEAVYKNPNSSLALKIGSMIAEFPRGLVVLLLDNFEDVIDPQSGSILDPELEEALNVFLASPPHSVKTILTTRDAPRRLLLAYPGLQRTLHLDQGLPSPYAENILRQMDSAGLVGLNAAPANLLTRARERTRGYPRALEALFAILSADRFTSLGDILNDKRLLPENVVETLVGEAFRRLDSSAQTVMQALAIYGRPVTSVAIDYLLRPYMPGVDSSPLLGRLVNMHFVRHESGRYYLHPVDSTYALSRVPVGEESRQAASNRQSELLLGFPLPFDHVWPPPRVEGDDEFTQFALRRRAADYFEEVIIPRAEWKTIVDLEPQLAQFELRFAAEDYDDAARVLGEVDFNYLRIWGHYRLLADLRESLQGKLSDPELRIRNYNVLGVIYSDVGDYQKSKANYEAALADAIATNNRAMECVVLANLGSLLQQLNEAGRGIELLQRAQTIARDIGDARDEAKVLGLLALCYEALGHTSRAIEINEQVLATSRKVADPRMEEGTLHNLANCVKELGQTTKARELYEQALKIAGELGYRQWQANHLSSLSACYNCLGQNGQAMDLRERALTIRREIGDRDGECSDLCGLADILIDQQQYEQAVERASESVAIANAVNAPLLANASNCVLALAQLYAGNLNLAYVAAQTAVKHEVATNYEALVALGLISLRCSDREAAAAAFAKAVYSADEMLIKTPERYTASDAKFLAFCGLAMCEGKRHVPTAIQSYRAARRVNSDPGVVTSCLRRFNALSLADSEGVLRAVREMARDQTR